MKRAVVIAFLVLIFSCGAQAALMLSLNGQPAPDEATLTVSSVVVIDGVCDNTSPYTVYLALANPGTTGEWASGLRTIWPPPIPPPEPIDGVWLIQNLGGYPAGKQWEVDFHCKAEGDAIITLYAEDWQTVIDSITFHQIPEPTTLGLLGLGGLLLCRRRQA